MKFRSIGFTGTRLGMTFAQKRALIATLRGIEFSETHSGDCLGADQEFVGQCLAALQKPYYTYGHPPRYRKYRAFCEYDYSYICKDYLERNRDIVNLSHLLIACPKEKENQRVLGGTWYTVRYARSKNLPLIIILPEGETIFENFTQKTN